MKETKNTTLRFLSHASLYLEGQEANLLIDPWLIGSCYWRSWWNYPPVKKETIADLKPDAVYISHVHWDHWHGVSLKKLIDKKTLIITHKEPNERSVRDLRKLGFHNIELLKHGQSTQLGDLQLTIYQFGLFLNDSALVVKNDDINLLDANDCKIAGVSLQQIIKKHGVFDFALRSHSSANDRILYKIKGDDRFSNDKPEHYAKSFKFFMDAVQPKYAVPFASNHCFLHKDVYKLNDTITDPYLLKKQLKELGGLNNSELKILLTGDIWSSSNGFQINNNNRFFTDKEKHIREYSNSKKGALEKFYKLESRLKVNKKIIEKFEAQLKSIPLLLRRKFKNWKFILILDSEKEVFQYVINPYAASVVKAENSNEVKTITAEIHIPIKIFIDAVALNMFQHSSISKRNRYLFDNINELKKYEKFLRLLEKVELEALPISIKYCFNFMRAYLRRWRELLVYGKAYLLQRKGLAIYDIEEQILQDTRTRTRNNI